MMKAMSVHSSKKTGFVDRMETALRSLDVFGEKVRFTYKGKNTYQTNIGAIVSIMVKAIMVIFIVYEFYLIFARKEPVVGVKTGLNSFVLDPNAPSEAFSPSERGFDIAVAVMMRNSSFTLSNASPAAE